MMSRRRVCRGIAVLLAVVAAVPVGTVAVASAPPVPASGPVGERWPGAAEGPYPSWQEAILGRPVSPPAVETAADTAGENARDAPEGAGVPMTYAPFGEAGARPAAACDGRKGPYQRQVERWLRRRVDGKQSAADCRAIRAFQKKHGIEPVTGIAGPVTWARMRALAARSAPHATRGCPERSYRVACVDLTHSLTWVQQRGRILYGPVPMRSGGVGHRTRTGWFRIYWRHRFHWSTLYNTPMPYAQFFSGGQAFHAIYGSIRTAAGSMGCVNLRLADARALWKVLRTRDRVYVWGRRPGS
ncbi:L,D-transpeptidase family protein [Streptomyces sp. NPDC091209]|uniref:L,D-transpeptidase family protein n=1 Tax=Streptomyces sp. NPDC091209 TaxID=3365974 RepID=UPI0038049003